MGEAKVAVPSVALLPALRVLCGRDEPSTCVPVRSAQTDVEDLCEPEPIKGGRRKHAHRTRTALLHARGRIERCEPDLAALGYALHNASWPAGGASRLKVEHWLDQ